MTSIATCQACGYAVAGLPSLTCPECGNDFRQVGIRRANESYTSSIAGPLWAATVIVCVAAIIVSCILSSVLYHVQVTNVLTFRPAYSWPAQPSHIQWLSITASGRRLQWNLGPFRQNDPVDTIAFQICAPSHVPVMLSVDTHRQCSVAGGPRQSFDQASVRMWLKAAGQDPNSADSRKLVDDILSDYFALRDGRIREVGFAELLASDASSSGSGSGASILYLPWCVAGLTWMILVKRIWSSRSSQKHSGGLCGKCDAIVSDNPDFTCARCKSDLRLVGIDVTRHSIYTGTAGPLTAIGLLVLVLGAVSATLLSSAFWQFNWNRNKGFNPRYDLRRHPAVQLIDIETSGYLLTRSHEVGSTPRPDRITLLCNIVGHRPAVMYSRKDHSFDIYTPGGQRLNLPLTPGGILQWLTLAGFDAKDPSAAKLAEDAVDAIALTQSGNLDQVTFNMENGGGVGKGWSGGDATWLGSLTWTLWLVIWIAAVAYQVERNRARGKSR